MLVLRIRLLFQYLVAGAGFGTMLLANHIKYLTTLLT